MEKAIIRQSFTWVSCLGSAVVLPLNQPRLCAENCKITHFVFFMATNHRLFGWWRLCQLTWLVSTTWGGTKAVIILSLVGQWNKEQITKTNKKNHSLISLIFLEWGSKNICIGKRRASSSVYQKRDWLGLKFLMALHPVWQHIRFLAQETKTTEAAETSSTFRPITPRWEVNGL